MRSGFFKLFKTKTEKNSVSMDFDAGFEFARSLNQRAQYTEAAAICKGILALQPDHVESLMLLADISKTNGDSEQAIELYVKVIALKPDHALAHYKRANYLKDRNQLGAALASYDQAIALDSGLANAFCNRGVVLARLNRLEAALDSYSRAIALNPCDALAYYNRGEVLRELRQPEQALASYDRAIDVEPSYADCYCNRGILLAELKQWDAALASYNRAIEIKPDSFHAYFNRGTLFQQLKQLDLALASYDQAIQINSEYAEAYCNRGGLLTELNQWDAALASFDRAIALKPDFAEAHCNRGILFSKLSLNEPAIRNFESALKLKPDYAEALYNRANALMGMREFPAAIASYDEAFALKPDLRFLLGARAHAKMHICEWKDSGAESQRIIAGLEADQPVSPPLPILALLDSARLQQRAARIWAREEYPSEAAALTMPTHPPGDQIRIGYFSGDFYHHPVAMLMAEVFEVHDRSKFDVTAFSFGPDTQDEMRSRLERGFSRFIDVRKKSDREIAMLARSLRIDIAVDLGGYTVNSRTGIFAARAAPIQINYLGYPGTMGAEYMDYLIADRTLIPEAQLCNYTEKIVYLPNSYLPNDSTRTVADTQFSREELHLPRTGFVFCCFNNSYKITPAVFDRWMRILIRVESSVLWLSQNNATAADNLRQEAALRGVSPERLVFANRTASLPEHLARLRVGDLFLDTLPYNAHATSIDALWAGLPVLTCMGEAFAGRVGASLLSALELPELITLTADQYEDLAVVLATNPDRLAEIRQKMARNRLKAPLFDTHAFTKQLEGAYTRVYRQNRAKLPPLDNYTQY